MLRIRASSKEKRHLKTVTYQNQAIETFIFSVFFSADPEQRKEC